MWTDVKKREIQIQLMDITVLTIYGCFLCFVFISLSPFSTSTHSIFICLSKRKNKANKPNQQQHLFFFPFGWSISSPNVWAVWMYLYIETLSLLYNVCAACEFYYVHLLLFVVGFSSIVAFLPKWIQFECFSFVSSVAWLRLICSHCNIILFVDISTSRRSNNNSNAYLSLHFLYYFEW